MDNKLLEVQKEIKTVKKELTNPFFKSKYADINAILAEVKPILNKYGLVLLQPIYIRDGKNVLQTFIMDGERALAESALILPEISDVQKFGAAITYCRRFALQSLLSLEAEDDDGNIAAGKTLPKAQAPRQQESPTPESIQYGQEQ